MKRFLFAVLMLIGAGLSAADTPTPTHTFTPTFTPTPIMVKDQKYTRQYFMANQFMQTDGITRLTGTAQPGGTTPFLKQNFNGTAAVFSTATAQARFGTYIVPADIDPSPKAGRIRMWAYCTHSSETNTVKMVVNAYAQKMNQLTSTAETMLGVTTNVQTQNYGPLQNSKMSRVFFPLPVALSRVAAGQALTWEIQRASDHQSGDLSIYAVEVEYDKAMFRNP